MWQRIQTLYLVLAGALTAALFFSNAITSNGPDGLEKIRYISLYKPYFLILLSIMAAGQLLALITFKSRILQMRLSMLFALVALGTQIWLGVMYFTAPEGAVFSWTVIFPLAICVFDVLAFRGCLQDQLLVESVSRLRTDRKNRKRR